MEERVIPVRGDFEIAVLEAGAGGRPLLLVHGFTGLKEDFADHVQHLADLGWWVVAPDLRGHGRSSRPAEESDYSLDLLAGDLWAVVDRLGWDTLVVLGHSMGGMVVQHAVLGCPHRVDGLILMDTTHGPLEGIDVELAGMAAEIARDQGMAVLKEIQDSIDAPLDSDAHARVVAERPGFKEFSDHKMLSASPVMYASMLPQMLDQADRLDRLGSLAFPTLVVVGEQDGPFLAASARMAAALPDARHVVIPGAGHSPQFENPAAWRDAVVGFLAELVGS